MSRGILQLCLSAVYELAKQAYLAYPQDEKVILDLSRYAFQAGNLDRAFRMAEHALAANPQFDLAFEHFAVMAESQGGLERKREYVSRALSLTPGSPINHLNLGITLCELGLHDEGGKNICEALRLYPPYREDPALRSLEQQGLLPTNVVELLNATG